MARTASLGRSLAQLPNRNNWVVEFGAWDGLHLSNSRHFITSQGFSAVLIEGSSERFAALQSLYADRPDVHTLNVFVRTSHEDTLDQLLETTPIPRDFDYLSIDIDGNDYHVWKSLEKFTPRKTGGDRIQSDSSVGRRVRPS